MPRKSTPKRAEPQDAELRSDDYVNVMSLCPMPLNLSTEPNGQGTHVRFEKFGTIQPVLYYDLVKIISNNRRFLEQGFFYILDERVTRRYGLSQVYENILTKEKLEQVFNLATSAAELYKHATDMQKVFIHRVLIRKVREGEYIDLNVLAQIEKLSGLDIMKLGREAKELMQEEQD